MKRKLKLLILVILAISIGCKKEETIEVTPPQVTYTMVGYSTSINEDAWMSIHYKTNRSVYKDKTIWIAKKVHKWSVSFDVPYESFTPAAAYSMSRVNGFDSVLCTIIIGDSIYSRYKM